MAAGVFVVGVVVLMTGAVMQLTAVGIVGFVVMLASAYVALSSWRGQSQAPEHGRTASDPHPSFSVIEGGRAKKRGPRSASAASPHHSIMERFEERWRRRRDQNGY